MSDQESDVLEDLERGGVHLRYLLGREKGRKGSHGMAP